MNRCKDCRNGIYSKKNDTVYCNIHEKTLLFDRDDCNCYDEKSVVRKRKEKELDNLFLEMEQAEHEKENDEYDEYLEQKNLCNQNYA